MNRFAFEVAERMLDAYCYAAERPASFRRAWSKLKLTAAVVGYFDFATERGRLDKAALAHGWEELQMAFTGRGSALLEGGVIDLWCSTPEREQRRIFAVFTEAFALAEARTDPDTARLYTPDLRNAPFVLLSHADSTKLVRVLPFHGPRLVDHALDHGHSVADFLAQHRDAEWQSRVTTAHMADTGLQVLPGGREDDA